MEGSIPWRDPKQIPRRPASARSPTPTIEGITTEMMGGIEAMAVLGPVGRNAVPISRALRAYTLSAPRPAVLNRDEQQR